MLNLLNKINKVTAPQTSTQPVQQTPKVQQEEYSFDYTSYSTTFDANQPQSANQVKVYHDICNRRGIPPQNISKLNFEQTSALIQELTTSIPASKAQLDSITSRIAELQSHGINISITDEELKSLTGGTDGTADTKIKELIEIKKKYVSEDALTPNQLNHLIKMYLCPDVPFEEYNVPRKYPIDHLESYSSDMDYDEQATQLWRRLTPDEFANEIKKKINKQTASEIISKYGPAFFKWSRSRITKKQINRIRQLEDRMSNITKPRIYEDIFNPQTGQIEQILVSNNEKLNTNNYTPLEDLDLMQLSVKDASNVIQMLEVELEDDTLRTSFVDEGELDKVKKFENIAEQNELEQLTGFLYHLMEDYAGYRDEELADAPALIDNTKELDDAGKRKIKQFMLHLISENQISLEELMSKTENISLAKEILLG